MLLLNYEINKKFYYLVKLKHSILLEMSDFIEHGGHFLFRKLQSHKKCLFIFLGKINGFRDKQCSFDKSFVMFGVKIIMESDNRKTFIPIYMDGIFVLHQ